MAFCTKCGSPIADGNSFCTKCGTKVGAAPTTPLDPSTPTAGSPTSDQPTAPGSKKMLIVIIAAVAAVALIVIAFVAVRSFGGSSDSDAQHVTIQSTSSESETSSESSSDSATITFTATNQQGQTLSEEIRLDASGYILPDSDTHLYTISELESLGLSDAELCLARNEIFARIGFDFTNSGLQDYFDQRSWYSNSGQKPNLESGSVADKNSLTIKQLEESHGSPWLNLAKY